MTFDTLGLRPESLRAVADQGYSDPTPIQAQAIPVILDGRDLLAGAQTGTGKTAAFVLPMLQTLHATRGPGPKRVRALIVVPTRELALQVEQSVRTYGVHRPIRSTTVFGGMRMDRQVRALRKGVEIVVATPGRLLDHVRQGTIDLGHVEILVLDEADRMLDMGFLPDIKRILEQLPRERQSLLFSATFSPRIRALANDFLRQPESIDVAPRNATAAPVRQLIHPVDKGRKRHLLSHMVRSKRIEQVLVFTRTKRGANRLAEQLGKDGIDAGAIHGNKSQSQRVKALTAFKQGHSQVLVATDIAARGLDIDALPHVVNYELPMVPEDYVHRIGRTGRAGQEGTAISLVSADEQELMLGIEKLLKRPIDREVVEGFEPQMAFRPEPIVTRRPKHGRSRPQQKSDAAWNRQGDKPRPGGRGKPGPDGRRGHSAGASNHASGRAVEPRHGAPNQALPGERLSGRRSPGTPQPGHRSTGTPQGSQRSASEPRHRQPSAGKPRRAKRSRDGVPQWEARGRRSRRS